MDIRRQSFFKPFEESHLEIELKVQEHQCKIFEAAKLNDFKEVKKLQYILVNSKEARFLAVKRVITKFRLRLKIEAGICKKKNLGCCYPKG